MIIQGNILNMINLHTANIVLNSEIPLLFNILLEVLVNEIRHNKKINNTERKMK